MRTLLLMTTVLTLAGCSSPEKTAPVPGMVGMANPASVHCIKSGGKLDMVKTAEGETGYCTLPSGERMEEWALFRRDTGK